MVRSGDIVNPESENDGKSERPVESAPLLSDKTSKDFLGIINSILEIPDRPICSILEANSSEEIVSFPGTTRKQADEADSASLEKSL